MTGKPAGARGRPGGGTRRAAKGAAPGTAAAKQDCGGGAPEAVPPQTPAGSIGSGGDLGAQVEAWELPLSPREEGVPPSETEKALLRVVKKLREVKAIAARLQAGEPVDALQRDKAARREEFLAEWAGLHEDVRWEREHSHTGGGRGFVTVRPGVPTSRPRSEDSAGGAPAAGAVGQGGRAGGRRAFGSGLEVSSAMLAELAWGGQPPPAAAASTASSRRRQKGEGGGGGEKGGGGGEKQDGGGWTVVVSQKAKRQQASDQDKEARLEAHTARQAMRVASVDSEVFRLTSESLKNVPLFTPADCDRIEELIEQVVVDAQRGLFKDHSVDLTPFRNKYFFGFAYTYGAQKDYPGARGVEAVWPPEDTSEIPAWIREIIIDKLEAKRVVPKGWINSATINDYAPGGFIVSHIDPPHLFDRPIISISFFEDCNLVFGARFGHPDEGPGEATVPALVHRCVRGNATVMKGYSADKITHGIRSCDLPGRRASVILRRVLPSAPVLHDGRVVPLQEHLKSRAPFG